MRLHPTQDENESEIVIGKLHPLLEPWALTQSAESSNIWRTLIDGPKRLNDALGLYHAICGSP